MRYSDIIVKTCCTTMVFLALLSMCPATQAGVGFQIRQDLDEYAVYSAVINREVAEKKSKLAVISGTTVFDKRYVERNLDALLQVLTPVTRGMLEDPSRQNSESRRLSENLKLNVRYVLLGKQSSQNTSGKTPAKTLPAAAIFGLSRVAFNDKKDLALVYSSINCGPRCGIGNLVVLSRADQGWKIVKEYRLWIA